MIVWGIDDESVFSDDESAAAFYASCHAAAETFGLDGPSFMVVVCAEERPDELDETVQAYTEVQTVSRKAKIVLCLPLGDGFEGIRSVFEWRVLAWHEMFHVWQGEFGLNKVTSRMEATGDDELVSGFIERVTDGIAMILASHEEGMIDVEDHEEGTDSAGSVGEPEAADPAEDRAV